MKIIKTDNYEKLSEVAANIIKKQIINKKNSVLGLATGSTPLGTYKKLIEMYNNEEISFKNIKTVNLDEYIGIDKENKQSYHYFMHKNFFSKIDILEENTNILNGMNKNDFEECSRYDKLIYDLKGIDLQILGLGLNGHIGFNEPYTSFETRTHKVTLDKSTKEANKRFFEKGELVPTKAYTMGIKTILEAKEIILLVSGEAKAKILKKILETEATEKIPATILNQHENVTIIADKDALKEIKEEYFD